jgi:hypothetical protein
METEFKFKNLGQEKISDLEALSSFLNKLPISVTLNFLDEKKIPVLMVEPGMLGLKSVKIYPEKSNVSYKGLEKLGENYVVSYMGDSVNIALKDQSRRADFYTTNPNKFLSKLLNR